MKIICIGILNLMVLIACNNTVLTEKKKYYENGILKEIYFLDEHKNAQGIAYEYFRNGKLKEVRHYLNGESNGLFKTFYNNGRIETKGKFRRSIQIDTTISYHENGKIDAISIFDKNGKTVKQISYYSNGKINIIRTFYVGTGQINTFKKYFEDGTLNEKESNFAEIKYIGRNKDSLFVKLYNCQYSDSIYVNIVKDFDYQFYFEAEVIRSLKFSNKTDFKLKILDADFINGKMNIQIITEKWFTPKNSKQNAYDIQINKDSNLPKDNVEGIYRSY